MGFKRLEGDLKQFLDYLECFLVMQTITYIPGLICIEILTNPISYQSLKVLNKEVKSSFCQSLRVRLHDNNVLNSKDL